MEIVKSSPTNICEYQYCSTNVINETTATGHLRSGTVAQHALCPFVEDGSVLQGHSADHQNPKKVLFWFVIVCICTYFFSYWRTKVFPNAP